MRPEQAIHVAVVKHLHWRGVKGLVFIHVPNGGYRSPVEAAIFKGLGVRPGASDLLLWHQEKSFALELKAPGGKATESQLKFLADMEKAGAYCCLAEGLDRAYAAALKQGIASLAEHGEPTEEELQAFTTWYQQMLETDRANNLVKIRSWLEREGGTLQ